MVVLVVATAASWARLDPVARANLWAEDGRDFVSDASTDGLGATLFRPFGGYLQFLPRLLAWVATRVTGPEHLAQVVTLLACATVGVVSALLWAYGRTLLGSDAAALLLAAVPPLIPTAPREALGTLTTCTRGCSCSPRCVFAAVPRRRWSAWAAAAIALVVLLSETAGGGFAPLLLLGIRSPRRWPLVGAVLLGAVAAVVTAGGGPGPVIDYGGDATVTSGTRSSGSSGSRWSQCGRATSTGPAPSPVPPASRRSSCSPSCAWPWSWSPPSAPRFRSARCSPPSSSARAWSGRRRCS